MQLNILTGNKYILKKKLQVQELHFTGLELWIYCGLQNINLVII
jgi:hypothetical protein